MATVKTNLDRKNPPRLSEETKTRLAQLSDEQLTANALADPDNPPLTEAELKRLGAARSVQRARAATGLSQSAFAKRFRINAARLKDWEQGRTIPDSAALAYLKVIEREPKLVERALPNSVSSRITNAPPEGTTPKNWEVDLNVVRMRIFYLADDVEPVSPSAALLLRAVADAIESGDFHLDQPRAGGRRSAGSLAPPAKDRGESGQKRQ